jgi:hypothetical protein
MRQTDLPEFLVKEILSCRHNYSKIVQNDIIRSHHTIGEATMNTIPLMILSTLAIQLPVLVALLIGIILCFTHWRGYPKPSLLAFLGLLLFMILTLINVLTVHLPYFLQSTLNMTYSVMAPIQTGVGIISSILHAVGYALLISAIFFRRKVKSDESTLPEVNLH